MVAMLVAPLSLLGRRMVTAEALVGIVRMVRHVGSDGALEGCR